MQPALSETQLMRLASNLGKEWKSLAIYLGIRRDEVDRIQADNPTTEDQIFRTLLTWQQRWDPRNDDGSRGALKCLCNALKETGRADLAECLGGEFEELGFTEITLSVYWTCLK